jgi:GDP-L-fucose synthase
MLDLTKQRIVMTGGAGFLGKHLQQCLLARGVRQEQILIPLIEDYALTKEVDCIRMYEMKPDVVIHLAAEVRGDWRQPRKSRTVFLCQYGDGITPDEQPASAN